MRRAFRKIACLLLAVMLATVLAPSFGAEASAGQNTEDHSLAALDDACGTPDRHDGERSGGDRSHHHGCAGHMFGHLAAYLDGAAVFTPSDFGSGFLSGPDSGVVQNFPERLDRPPLAPALA